MNKYIVHFCVILLSSLLLGACREDESIGADYVPTANLHLKYNIFGDSKPFSSPIILTLVNATEQVTYQYESDLWGKVVLDHLLPGEYTVNATGNLTAEEVSEITGEAAKREATLTGFVANIKLSLNTPPSLDGLALILPSQSSLIFKELYYAGSRTPSQGSYRNDNFYTIYNNSTLPVLLNNIYIGNVESYGGIGAAGPLWPSEVQGAYKHAYLKTAWKIIAGKELVYIQPGQSITIATMAAPHNKDAQYNLNSPVDLSNADYEAYSPDAANSYPNFPAADMQRAFWPDYSDLWRIGVFGQGMVLIQANEREFSAFETVTLPESFQDPFESEEYWLCLKVPAEYVIDAVDLIQNATVTNTKRFPPILDSGFTTIAGTYKGQSVIRKVIGKEGTVTLYQDTNNSTQDFEVNDKPLSK